MCGYQEEKEKHRRFLMPTGNDSQPVTFILNF